MIMLTTAIIIVSMTHSHDDAHYHDRHDFMINPNTIAVAINVSKISVITIDIIFVSLLCWLPLPLLEPGHDH